MRASTEDGPAAIRATGAPWAPGPHRPHLEGHALHVWRADLRRVREGVSELLSEQEQERAARFAARREGVLWGRSRGVLRALLGRYACSDPRGVSLTRGELGKPELSEPGRGATVHFNLSHSRHLALYAFSVGGPVGVDVQLIRERDAGTAPDYVALAARAFGRERAQRLDELELAQREREFLRLWTRHEAALKRHGTGIAGGRGRAHDALEGHLVCELDVGEPAAVAAAALTLPASELQRWAWS
jgi:4'-phosphopantetheinyl transferase